MYHCSWLDVLTHGRIHVRPNSARSGRALTLVCLDFLLYGYIMHNDVHITRHKGRNAINILSNLGVYEDICTRAKQVEAAAAKEVGARPGPSHQGIDGIRGWFRFHSGMGDHEVLSDVSIHV